MAQGGPSRIQALPVTGSQEQTARMSGICAHPGDSLPQVLLPQLGVTHLAQLSGGHRAVGCGPPSCSACSSSCPSPHPSSFLCAVIPPPPSLSLPSLLPPWEIPVCEELTLLQKQRPVGGNAAEKKDKRRVEGNWNRVGEGGE